MVPIFGNLVCQNNIHEVLRCIESVAPLVDKYYVMDGGSTDGTWEMLNKYKDIYNLELYQHPYDALDLQRNRLLYKTPKDAWVINLDSDEEFNHKAQMGLRKFIEYTDTDVITGKWRDLPLTIPIQHIVLINDLRHYCPSWTGYHASRIFYNDRNLHWEHDYHCVPVYFGTEKNSNSVPCPRDWVVFHHMLLSPYRKESLKDDIKSWKRHYRLEEFENLKSAPLPTEWL